MRYQLNFSETALTEPKRKRVILLSATLYILVLSLSIGLILHTYKSRVFVANVFQERVLKLQEKISIIEPRILFLEQRSAERNRLKKQVSLFAQERNRPSIWYARLIDLARLLPADAVLTEILFSPQPEERGNNPAVTINGYMLIKGKTEDITPLDNFRNSLAESVPLNFTYPRLQVENNSFQAENRNTRLVFSLGFYE